MCTRSLFSHLPTHCSSNSALPSHIVNASLSTRFVPAAYTCVTSSVKSHSSNKNFSCPLLQLLLHFSSPCIAHFFQRVGYASYLLFLSSHSPESSPVPPRDFLSTPRKLFLMRSTNGLYLANSKGQGPCLTYQHLLTLLL